MKGTNKVNSTWKFNLCILTLTEVFVNQKRINVCEHTGKLGLTNK